MKGKVLIALLSISLLVVLIGCQPATTPTQISSAPTSAPTQSSGGGTPTVYKIGFSGPLTGDGAYYGQAEKEGIELAVEEFNKTGGINGVPVQVVYEDDRNNTADAQTVLLKLAETDKVPIVIGINTSSITMATCKKAEELKVVQYSIGSNPKIASTCGDYTFLVMGNDLQQGQEIAKVGQWLKAQTAVAVYINNDYGIGAKTAFVNAAPNYGITVLAEIPLQPEGKDYRTEALQVKTLNPDMLTFIAYGAEGSVFLRQAKEIGLQTHIVGDNNWADETMWNLAGDALTGMITLQTGKHGAPEFQTYAAAFKAKYNKEPSIWSEYFYDELILAAKAIEKGGYTGDGIREATHSVTETFIGASGPKKLDEHNYVQYSFDWVQWQSNGKLTLVQH